MSDLPAGAIPVTSPDAERAAYLDRLRRRLKGEVVLDDPPAPAPTLALAPPPTPEPALVEPEPPVVEAVVAEPVDARPSTLAAPREEPDTGVQLAGVATELCAVAGALRDVARVLGEVTSRLSDVVRRLESVA